MFFVKLLIAMFSLSDTHCTCMGLYICTPSQQSFYEFPYHDGMTLLCDCMDELIYRHF